MKQLTFLLFLIVTISSTFAQELTVTKYFDKIGDSTGKENAFTYTVTTYTDLTKKASIVRSYFITGQQESEFSYRDSSNVSMYDGNFIMYHENGQPKIKGRYISNNLDSGLITWYANGQIKRKDEYMQGT